MAKKLIPDIERFFRSIKKRRSGCWEWQLSIDRDGYGVWRIGSHTDASRKQVKAHRWAYEQFKKPIPVGLQIDHLCRNRCCVNPDHLDVVTVLENARRGWRKNKTHCNHGHPYSGDNLYIRNGKRYCRKCVRRHAREYEIRTNYAAMKKYRRRLRDSATP